MTFSTISDLWNKWNIRGFVILSLTVQVFLILFAPLREKIKNRPIVFLLWLAYLMADWVAPFAIGLINQHQGRSSACATEVDGALQAFWASFLLLHLGGQDTITAFSMEDSWLWRRHLLTLIFQIGAAIYVFVQLFPNNKSLVIPTMLVFCAAVIKNVERTLALHLSSLPRLKESMLTKHKYLYDVVEKLKNEGRSGGEHGQEEEPNHDESTIVKHAYLFFEIFKVFIVDLMFTFPQRTISRDYFRKVSPIDALKVISIELHFMYEVLHTKVLTIHSKQSYIFRFIALANIVMAFILFNSLKKHQLSKPDVEITYILLSGGIALDVIALLRIVLSDWTIARIMCNCQGSSKLYSFLRKLVSAMANLRKPRFTTCETLSNGHVTYNVLGTPVIFKRWSESIFACNLLSESLKKCPRKMCKRDWHQRIITFSDICNFQCYMPEKIIFCFNQAGKTIARRWGLENAEGKIPMIENTKYVTENPFMKKLWIFIFEEVRMKSAQAEEIDGAIKIFNARGDLFLQSISEENDSNHFLDYVTITKYDASIIIWHLATEICYNIDDSDPNTRCDEREFSKILSDYMFYLLVNQPDVMSAVAGIAQLRSMETLRELQKNFGSTNMEALCRELIREGHFILTPRSELREGINLAREMLHLGEVKWRVTSGVWVEMLSYAAIRIKGEVHVRVLSKGGELLTFVWLLMVHLGCFYKPEWGIYYENWYERSRISFHE